MQSLYEETEKKEEEIREDIQDKVDKENGVSRPVGMSVYAGAVLVALIIVGLVAL